MEFVEIAHDACQDASSPFQALMRTADVAQNAGEWRACMHAINEIYAQHDKLNKVRTDARRVNRSSQQRQLLSDNSRTLPSRVGSSLHQQFFSPNVD